MKPFILTWWRTSRFLRKSYTWTGGRGRDKDEPAQTMRPGGWPASLFIRTPILIPLLLVSDCGEKSSLLTIFIIHAKFLNILSPKCITLFLPRIVCTTTKKNHNILNYSYIPKVLKLSLVVNIKSAFLTHFKLHKKKVTLYINVRYNIGRCRCN